MKVAQLSAPHDFRLIEGQIAPPGPGEVQVRVRAVGICGSDMHYYSEGSIGDIPCQYPMVLGHEPTGEIAALGMGVPGWSIGDKAVLEPAVYCYHCEFCLTGHHNVCEHIRFLSMPGDPGFFREFVNLPLTNVLPMPAELSFEENTLFEPLAIALHSMKFARVETGGTAAIFGCGPIGLVTIAVLKLSGARRIYAVEPVEARRALARSMGATAAIDPKSADPVETIKRDTQRRGVDVAIDCAAKPGTINQCIRTTRNAGRVVVTGIPSEPQVALDLHVMRRNEIRFYNVRRSNHETEAGLALLREHPKFFGPLVTHTRPIDRIDDAFRLVESYADGVGKMVVTL
jgi:L-iditol 2-dehydrogenase